MKSLVQKVSLMMGLILAAIIVPFFLFGHRLEVWAVDGIESVKAHQGLTGLFLGGLLASDILLPIPSSVVSLSCGYLLGPLWGTVTSWCGMNLGCLLGYWMGVRLGPLTVGRYFSAGDFDRLEVWRLRAGIWMLAICRPIPVLAEASTVFAGIMSFGWAGFFVITMVTNFMISAAYAVVGSVVH
jgi:uncharacterized membrane protein YdjX (TVP38/TMEM64 family)